MTLTPQKVVQNEVEVTFNPDKIKKGTAAGSATLRPDLSKLDLAAKIKYIGEKNVDGILIQKMNSLANAVFNASVNEDTGELDIEKWSKLIQGIAIQGETLEDLRDRLLEIGDEQRKMLLDESIPLESIRPKIKELSKEVQEIEETIQKREADFAERAAKRKATQEAAKAAAPAPVQA